MNGSRGAKAFKAPNKLSSVRDAANEQAPAEAQERPGLKALCSAFGRPVAAPLHMWSGASHFRQKFPPQALASPLASIGGGE